MKRISITLAALLICFAFSAKAQIQQGFVKTIGRPDRPGVALEKVVVRIQGTTNFVMSDSLGAFSINMHDKKEGDPIVLASVSKQGYELHDKDCIGRQMAYSTKVPIYILMVDLKQLAIDKRKIEEKAYDVAEENYQKKLAELEKRRDEAAITAENYYQELQELQRRYESYLSLIDDMADRYARTDYDQLDSIDYQINLCIENGELDKADSLIHTVFDPETVLERNRAAKEEIRKRIEFAQSIIDKANADKEAILRDRDYAERIAELCVNLAEEYLQQERREEARRCLEQALDIRKIINGEDSSEVESLRSRIHAMFDE